jgi:hypothetical protein
VGDFCISGDNRNKTATHLRIFPKKVPFAIAFLEEKLYNGIHQGLQTLIYKERKSPHEEAACNRPSHARSGDHRRSMSAHSR